MNNWTTLSDIKADLNKRWSKGQFLQVDSAHQFPLSIRIKHPSSQQLADDFAACQQWVKQFKDSSEYRIEWKEFDYRRLGKNRIPVAVVFEKLNDVIGYLNKQKDYAQFQQLAKLLVQNLPQLSAWLAQYPFKVLHYANELQSLILVTLWMQKNPQPSIYLRQIKLPEVDTKLVEQHKKLLTEWWDIVLPDQHIQQQTTGIKKFEQRYGFNSKPQMLRFRILDQALSIKGLTDLAIPEEDFCALNLDVDTVFVTENDINGLTFPDFSRAIVLFGRGYGFDYLEQASWLKNKQIYYWGDIDTHGFAILNQFRQHLPQTKSLLMDEETLMSHRQQWVKEQKPTQVDLPHLNEAEHKLYNRLRYNQIQQNLRLEQEYVSYSMLLSRLKG